MGIQATPEVKFGLIRETKMQKNNLLKIRMMCEIDGVSRFGYYNRCVNEDARKMREDADRMYVKHPPGALPRSLRFNALRTKG